MGQQALSITERLWSSKQQAYPSDYGPASIGHNRVVMEQALA